MNLQLTSGRGLLGRWGLNENGNVTATNSITGSANGTLRSNNISTHPTNGGPSWSTDGFVGNNNNTNQPPNQPANPSPANNTSASSLSPNLCVNVSDPNGGTVRVRFLKKKNQTPVKSLRSLVYRIRNSIQQNHREPVVETTVCSRLKQNG
jgi:hypothetical protein